MEEKKKEEKESLTHRRENHKIDPFCCPFLSYKDSKKKKKKMKETQKETRKKNKVQKKNLKG